MLTVGTFIDLISTVGHWLSRSINADTLAASLSRLGPIPNGWLA